jgi:predicted nucleic acid-binding protein
MEMVRAIRPDGLAISVIVYGEVREGILGSQQPAIDLQRWQRFMAGLDVLNVTLPVAEVWAELRRYLRTRGNLVPDADLLIASTALAFGMTLVTRNVKDFARVPDLALLVF